MSTPFFSNPSRRSGRRLGCAVGCAIVLMGTGGCQREGRTIETVAEGNSRLSTLAPIMSTGPRPLPAFPAMRFRPRSMSPRAAADVDA